MKPNLSFAGLGSITAHINVYTANRPPVEPYLSLTSEHYIEPNEINSIAQQTGNHWRKIFNVYAKLYFEFEPNGYNTWQILRDKSLLQKGGDQALWFVSNPQSVCVEDFDPNKVHLFMGKMFAINVFSEKQLQQKFVWINKEFAINKTHKIIICPYFDYRQLSNKKISDLVKLIKSL